MSWVPPHCSAIAAAIPGMVRLRSFQRFDPGEALCTRAVRPETILVGFNGGRFLSHRQVAFVSPCPNCHGWMIWLYFGIRSLAYLC